MTEDVGRYNRKRLSQRLGRKKMPTDECASQEQECLVNVRSLLVPHSQTPKLIEPGEGSFYYPPPLTQSAAMFGVSLGEPRSNPANSQPLADCFGVITTVAYDAIRAIARPSPSSL